jgi:hypothetical protein
MAERYSEEEGFSKEDRSLEGRLKDYPELKAKIAAMLAIIENAGGGESRGSGTAHPRSDAANRP